MFEIHVGELRATFLRNHNMRCHKDPSGRQPKQKTPTSPATTTGPGSTSLVQQAEDAHIPGNHHKHGGAAPDKGHCTRYVAVHPNRRGALPTDRVHCPNTQEQTRNWHTEPLTATPLHAQLGPTGGRMGTPPTPPPALRPTPTPPTPLHAKSRFSRPSAGLRVSWRPGRAAGCRNGPAGARGDHASRGQARSACGSRDNQTLGQRLLYSSVHADHCFAS